MDDGLKNAPNEFDEYLRQGSDAVANNGQIHHENVYLLS